MRTVRFQETDRVPLYDILDNDAVIEHYAGQPLTVENGTRVKGLAIGRVLDMTRMPGGPRAAGETRAENGIVTRHERWTSWIVERPFHDTASTVEWIKGEICRANDQVYDRAYAEQTYAAIRAHQANFAAGAATGGCSDSRGYQNSCGYSDSRSDPTVLVLESGAGLTEIYHQLGMQRFSYLLADKPGLIEEWLEARLQAELRRVQAIADPAWIPIALTYDDIAYKTGPLFSPAWLRRTWVPGLKRLVDAWHQRDTVCLFHSDGNLWPVLDDLVGAGIDGLNPLEVLAGMTVREVRRRYPSLFLTGGIDVSQLLPLGTPEEVGAICRQTIADAGGRGYFLGSSTELHWDVKLENAIAMFETAWEMET